MGGAAYQNLGRRSTLQVKSSTQNMVNRLRNQASSVVSEMKEEPARISRLVDGDSHEQDEGVAADAGHENDGQHD